MATVRQVHKQTRYSHSDTCVYPGCHSRSRNNIQGLKFFRFPVADRDRTAKWLSNSGLEHLADHSDSVLKSYTLCSQHFAIVDILPSGRLRRCAVPLEYMDYDSEERIITDDDAATWAIERRILQKRILRVKREFLKTKKQNEALKLFLKAKSKAISRLHTRMEQGILTDNSLAAAIKRRIQGFLCVFIMMQLFHVKGTAYTEDEKKISMKMHYTSPSLYQKMREELGFVLPSLSTMKGWFGSVQLWPGICSSLFEYLRVKVNCMSEEERQCNLLFDEISLKKGFDFHETFQKIEGFEDLGSLGCSSGVATSAMVFMVRGLFYNWKQPVAYFISAQVIHASKLSILIDKVLEAVMSVGLNVRAIVCDQGTNNESALYGKIDGQNPFFMYQNKKIYTIFDTLHIFKSFRNQLLKYDVAVNESGRMSWEDVLALWQLESDKGTRAALKLSQKHVAPNCFEKMKCRLALQVFSRRVAAALFTAHATGAIDSDTVIHTANAFVLLNDLFDNLNSRTFSDANPQKCALSDLRPNVENNILSSLEEIKSWRTLTDGGPKIPPCFQGLNLSITAILQLWYDLKNEGVKYLMTSRLNQDPIENLFSMIRTYGGSYNQNPTAKSFRLILQKNIVMNLAKPAQSANCLEDDDEVLLEKPAVPSAHGYMIRGVNEMQRKEIYDNNDAGQNGSSSDLDHDSIFIEPSVIEENSFEGCAIEYFAGYVAMKSIAKTKCEKCQGTFLDKNQKYIDARQTLIFYRAYDTLDGDDLGHLSVPSSEFSFIFRLMNEIFDKAYPQLRSEYSILDKVFILIERAVHTKYPGWFHDVTCGFHRKTLVYFMMKVKIHKNLKWLGNALRNITRVHNKLPQKLKNVHNS